MFRRDNVDAVRERSASKIGVEKRDHAADLSDAEPDGQVLGPIRHEQADTFAFRDALRDGPAGVAIRPLSQRAIGEAFAFGKESGSVAGTFGEFLDDGRENAFGIAGEVRGPLERAHPGLRGAGRFGRGFRHAVLPASTVITVPVMFFDLQLSRYSTALAMSSTWVMRLSALRRAICCRCSSLRPCVSSVSTKPATTAFTLTPTRSTSRARDLVKPISEALVAP